MSDARHEDPEPDEGLDDVERAAKHADEDRDKEQDHADADVAPSEADGDPDLF
jgi:hypothetical protein